jgi:cell division protein FtsA
MNEMRVVLDIGNGYLKGIVFGQEGEKPIVLAKEMVKTRGMRKGKILDVEDFAVSINELLESFSKKLGGDFVEEVFVGISHPETVITRVREQKRILQLNIGNDDIQHLSDVLAEAGGKPNYEVIKIIPVQWIIDDQTKLKDPLGMEARKLELIADVFMVPRTFYNNLFEAFDRLDLQVADVVPNILGAAEVCLDFDLKDLGVLLVDIGTNQTSYVVYEEGYPVFYGVIPVGGEEVTKDISIGLQVDIKDAEQIKREKGVIMLGGTTREDEAIDVRFLSDIMIARYEEIFELIQEDLQSYDKDGRLPGGVILIGGGAKVEHLTTLAKDVFKLATFRGHDKVVKLGELSQNLQFINLLGDYVRANKYHTGKKSMFSFSMKFGLFERIRSLIKHLI